MIGNRVRSVVHLGLAIIATLAVVLPAVPVFGQSTTVQMSIDAPKDNTTVTPGTQVDIGGWAVDPAGPGTGIDKVRVYLDNKMESNGTLLGDATYPKPRPDVAQALGNANFANSGFDYLWTPASNLSSGTHTLYVYAHSIANNWAYKTVTVSVQGAPSPAPGRGGQYGPGYGMGYGGGYGGGYGYGMGPGYGYPGSYYPGPLYPPSPAYPPPLPGGGRVCIMIYPPPPGC